MVNAEKNNLKEWIEVLGRASAGDRYQGLFRKVYWLVAVPSRKRGAVNLYKINKYTKEGDNVIVPRKVLSVGKLDHKVNIAALEYSDGALRQLKAAGCKVSTIKEMVGQSKINVIV